MAKGIRILGLKEMKKIKLTKGNYGYRQLELLNKIALGKPFITKPCFCPGSSVIKCLRLLRHNKGMRNLNWFSYRGIGVRKQRANNILKGTPPFVLIFMENQRIEAWELLLKTYPKFKKSHVKYHFYGRVILGNHLCTPSARQNQRGYTKEGVTGMLKEYQTQRVNIEKNKKRTLKLKKEIRRLTQRITYLKGKK